MVFGISGTKGTVRIIEVSVRRGQTVFVSYVNEHYDANCELEGSLWESIRQFSVFFRPVACASFVRQWLRLGKAAEMKIYKPGTRRTLQSPWASFDSLGLT